MNNTHFGGVFVPIFVVLFQNDLALMRKFGEHIAAVGNLGLHLGRPAFGIRFHDVLAQRHQAREREQILGGTFAAMSNSQRLVVVRLVTQGSSGVIAGASWPLAKKSWPM